MSLLEQEYDEHGRVGPSQLAAAVFELAEKLALEVRYETRRVRLVKCDRPLDTLDRVQQHLLSCLFPKGKTEVSIVAQSRGTFGVVPAAMNRFLSGHTATVNHQRRQEWRRLRGLLNGNERQRERERRTIPNSALSWLLWLYDGTTAQVMQPICRAWAEGTHRQPEWWKCQGRWPDEHGNLLALTYGMLVQSFT